MKDPNPLGIDDPFADSLPLMITAARRLCRNQDSPEDSCFAYHTLWPYLRRVRLRQGAWGRSRHYVASFRALARSGLAKVLIYGCADYSLLAHILFAYRAEKVEPRVTVLDLCESPLLINRWYADRHHTELATVASCVADNEGDSSFDVITTDNFLSQFPPQERSRILDRWRQLLRPGGRVITSQHIYEGAPEIWDPRKPEEVAKIRKRTFEYSQADKELLDITPDELADLAYNYYSTKTAVSYPFASSATLKSLFQDRGFKVDECTGLSAKEQRDWGKRITGKKERFWITATRRPPTADGSHAEPNQST